MKHLHTYIPEHKTIISYGVLHTFEVDKEELVAVATRLYRECALPLSIITAFDERDAGGDFKIMYVFFVPEEHAYVAPFLRTDKTFPSLTPHIHEASDYERKIQTFFGLVPEGHPNPRPIIMHENWPKDVYPLRKDFKWDLHPKEVPERDHPFVFNRIEGEGIYELPVGPVHAGIIEPGHFRFNLAGEEILSLEPRLGYSHKGVEKLFETFDLEKSLTLSEHIVGDSAFAYSMLFCQAIETAAGVRVSERAKYLRTIFAELERLANHFGDIGAIMMDTGFNVGMAEGARMRETIMQLNDDLSGSRFLRGVNRFGGVATDLDTGRIAHIREVLEGLKKDFAHVVSIAENSSTLLNRLKETGILPLDIAKDHGATGIAGRACGIARDMRVLMPYAAYADMPVEIATAQSGDVYGRFVVRIKEVFNAFAIISDALDRLPTLKAEKLPEKITLKPNQYVISIVEAWRGDTICLLSTDGVGRVARVALRDPSFLNWPALGYAGKGNMVPDFPLINKSFNLSYTGTDL